MNAFRNILKKFKEAIEYMLQNMEIRQFGRHPKGGVGLFVVSSEILEN